MPWPTVPHETCHLHSTLLLSPCRSWPRSGKSTWLPTPSVCTSRRQAAVTLSVSEVPATQAWRNRFVVIAACLALDWPTPSQPLHLGSTALHASSCDSHCVRLLACVQAWRSLGVTSTWDAGPGSAAVPGMRSRPWSMRCAAHAVTCCRTAACQRNSALSAALSMRRELRCSLLLTGCLCPAAAKRLLPKLSCERRWAITCSCTMLGRTRTAAITMSTQVCVCVQLLMGCYLWWRGVSSLCLDQSPLLQPCI